jgi:uncharacterized protein (DUF1697 family)
MALVVFLKGINVGGHRRFRPSLLAQDLARFGVVNIGAAGTFVIRKPVSEIVLRRELTRRLPFDAEVMICKGNAIVRLAQSDPFRRQPSGPDIVRFVSVLARRRPNLPQIPLNIPAEGDWGVRVLACRGRFVLGVYRRNMRAIGYLGQLERLFGAPATTRNWNTIAAIARILKDG